MTELQYGLLGLGATAIIGVLAYNKWQEHKHRKLAEQVLKARHADVLLDPADAAAAADAAIANDANETNDNAHALSFVADQGDAALNAGFASAAAAAAVYVDAPVGRQEPVLRLDPRLDTPAPGGEAQAMAGAAEAAVRTDDAQSLAYAARFESGEFGGFGESRESGASTQSTAHSLPPSAELAGAPGARPLETFAESRPAATKAPAPEFRDAPREAREARDFRSSIPPAHLLSPAVDFIAAFEAVEPAPAYQILEAQGAALACVRKPIHWIGYNERSREWEAIVDDGDSEYRRIRIALQLVDRTGPANDADLSAFCLAMQDLSDELMAVADLPSRQPALNAAFELDQFCASVDIQIGINVVAQGQSFAGTKLRALAEAAGLALDAEGHFVRCDDEGNVLYLLTNQESTGFSAETVKTMHTHALTFLLDVPRVAHGERVFNQMVDLARRFAEALHGTLVDDNRRPLSEGALEPIRRQVGQYQAAMAAHQIPAGGPLALRLFA